MALFNSVISLENLILKEVLHENIRF